MTDPIVWRGPEALRAHLVPLSAVAPHPANPKDHDLGAIAASIARFGQQQPILVQRSTGWIVAGNGRWEATPMVGELEAALEVGPGEAWTHIAAIFTEMDDLEAKAYALADNRTHDLGGYHDDKLAALLSELAGADQLMATGYDADDVDNLLASLRPFVPIDVAPPAAPELGSEVRIEVACSRAFLRTIEPELARWSSAGAVVSIA